LIQNREARATVAARRNTACAIDQEGDAATWPCAGAFGSAQQATFWSAPMILKAAAVGLILWAAATALFRFAGHFFFVPDSAILTLVFSLSVPLVALVTFLVLMWLGEDPSDRAETAIALAMPGMLIDVWIVNNYDTIFPNLDPMLGQTFGAFMLLGYATMIITGLFLTRMAPKDEQL
jgi:hypothetical protein